MPGDKSLIPRILLVILLSFSTAAFAKVCTLEWDASESQDVVGYTVYADKKEIILLSGLSHVFKECYAAEFAVTATNKYGIESELSESVIVGQPKMPRSIRFSVTGVIEFFESVAEE